MIGVFEHIGKLKEEPGFEQKTFEKIKGDLEGLFEYEPFFKGLDKSKFFDLPEKDVFIDLRLLISEIKEKEEITDQLHSLAYNVGLLRAAVLTRDDSKISRINRNTSGNEYSGVLSIVEELDSLENKIKKLEVVHSNLLKSNFSTEIKSALEEEFKVKQEKLKELHKKQKNILINLADMLLKLSQNQF